MPFLDQFSYFPFFNIPSSLLIAVLILLTPVIYLRLKYSSGNINASPWKKTAWNAVGLLLFCILLSLSGMLATQRYRCKKYCINKNFTNAEFKPTCRYTVLEGTCVCYQEKKTNYSLEIRNRVEIPFYFGYARSNH